MLTNNLLAGGNPVTPGNISNPAFSEVLQGILSRDTSSTFFNIFLPKAITLILIVGVVIFLFMLIMGAIQWISSGGDKGGLEAARSKITNALIGIIILFSVFAVAKLIETFFGISILTLDIGSLIIK